MFRFDFYFENRHYDERVCLDEILEKTLKTENDSLIQLEVYGGNE